MSAIDTNLDGILKGQAAREAELEERIAALSKKLQEEIDRYAETSNALVERAVDMTEAWLNNRGDERTRAQLVAAILGGA